MIIISRFEQPALISSLSGAWFDKTFSGHMVIQWQADSIVGLILDIEDCRETMEPLLESDKPLSV